jgi:hypothetical protein
VVSGEQNEPAGTTNQNFVEVEDVAALAPRLQSVPPRSLIPCSDHRFDSHPVGEAGLAGAYGARHGLCRQKFRLEIVRSPTVNHAVTEMAVNYSYGHHRVRRNYHAA